MVEQVVEQKMADIRVVPGMTVAAERRPWTSKSKAERRRRRMLTKSVLKKQAGE